MNFTPPVEFHASSLLSGITPPEMGIQQAIIMLPGTMIAGSVIPFSKTHPDRIFLMRALVKWQTGWCIRDL